MFKITFIVKTTLFLMAMSSASLAAEYYVDIKNGQDNNAGEIVSPWKTIAKANQSLRAGDTVYIREGTYNEKIRPLNSGSSGNPITYSRYEKDNVIVKNTSGDGADLRSRSFITLSGIRFIGNSLYAVNGRNSSGVYSNIIIRECYFNDNGAWAHIRLDRIDYSKILDSIFNFKCTATSLCGRECGRPKGDHLGLYDCHYALIEGNEFNNVSHAAMTVRTINRGNNTSCILRRNVFKNKLHHALEFYEEASNNIIEKNIITDSGEDYSINYCGGSKEQTMTREKQSGLHLSHTSNNIIRQNLFVNNGKLDLTTYYEITPATNNHIYNNTIDHNIWGWHIVGITANYNNIFKNNIFSNIVSYAIYRDVNNAKRDNAFINNRFSGGKFRFSPDAKDISLSSLQQNYPLQWQNNIPKNSEDNFPRYIDEKSGNYYLSNSSPMIDSGAFLTVTTIAGSGNVITVEDAGYFTDGLGIIGSDYIQLQGQTRKLKITAIRGNTITVDKNITWLKGVGVSLPYSGSAPDIGAFEKISTESGTTPALAAPKDLRVIY